MALEVRHNGSSMQRAAEQSLDWVYQLMTYQFTCCIATLWTFTANIRLHTFMSKYVLGWCSVILIVDTPTHPHCQFQSLPQMNFLHIHTITNISARVNNHMQTVIAIHRHNTWNNVQTCSNVGYIITDHHHHHHHHQSEIYSAPITR